jgi:hypothetical protein
MSGEMEEFECVMEPIQEFAYVAIPCLPCGRMMLDVIDDGVQVSGNHFKWQAWLVSQQKREAGLIHEADMDDIYEMLRTLVRRV